MPYLQALRDAQEALVDVGVDELEFLRRVVVGVCLAPSDARPPRDAIALPDVSREYRYLRSIRDDRIFLLCHVPPRTGEFRARLSFDRALFHTIEAI